MSKAPRLQAQELRFLHDREFLKAKLHIQQEMHQLLGLAANAIRQEQDKLGLPPSVWEVAPKISRGENYEELPYLVLDYPRIFQHDATFAFRTMLWWGWGFSCTLHIAGDYWQQYRSRLLQSLPLVKDAKNWWVCVNNTPWEYHYRPDNYIGLQEFLQLPAVMKAATKNPFFKVSRRLPLKQYQELPQFSLDTLRQFACLLGYA